MKLKDLLEKDLESDRNMLNAEAAGKLDTRGQEDETTITVEVTFEEGDGGFDKDLDITFIEIDDGNIELTDWGKIKGVPDSLINTLLDGVSSPRHIEAGGWINIPDEDAAIW